MEISCEHCGQIFQGIDKEEILTALLFHWSITHTDKYTPTDYKKVVLPND